MAIDLLGGTLGLVTVLAFAINLWFLGGKKRKRIRGVRVRTYGTMANRQHTHRPTERVTGGTTIESCNTDFSHVGEETVDKEFFLRQKM